MKRFHHKYGNYYSVRTKLRDANRIFPVNYGDARKHARSYRSILQKSVPTIEGEIFYCYQINGFWWEKKVK